MWQVTVQRPMWQVLMGRKDGTVSIASEAVSNLPSSFANFTNLLGDFQSNGLDIVDLVALSGAHTIGVSHCFGFSRRLYNFTEQGDADPSLDPAYADLLRSQCPSKSPNPLTTVEMDHPDSSLSFDSHYYRIFLQNMGLFQSNAALLTDPRSKQLVKISCSFAAYSLIASLSAMMKMGAIGVLTGDEGEIRQQCRLVN